MEGVSRMSSFGATLCLGSCSSLIVQIVDVFNSRNSL